MPASTNLGLAIRARSMLGAIALTSIDQLPLRPRRQLLFLLFQRRRGRFSAPRTFSEKVNWRIINDRRFELTWTCDKLEIKRRAEGLGIRVPTTFWAGTDISTLRGVSLPDSWVLKPNHRSGLVYFGVGDPGLAELRRVTRGWLDKSEVRKGEWAYSRARSSLLVEEDLSQSGLPPADYKIFVFHGDPALVTADVDRFGDHLRSFYDTDWTPIDARCLYKQGAPISRPENLPEMLETARRIAGSMDFLRVDLYTVDGLVYLGEVTAYPHGGLDPIEPYSLDLRLGQRWDLPEP